MGDLDSTWHHRQRMTSSAFKCITKEGRNYLGDNAKNLTRALAIRGEYLEKIIAETSHRMDQFEQTNSMYSNCSIRTEKKYNSFQYFLRENPKDTCGKYLKKKEQNVAKQILQYEYDGKILKYAADELKYIQRYLKCSSPEKIASVYGNYSDARKALVDPIELTDEEYVAKWKNFAYTGKDFMEGDPFFFTDLGEKVRSKSEAFIANLLAQNGIPYRYECPRKIKDFGRIYPDFTVLDVKRRREIIWEHFGLLGKSDYLEKTVVKLNKYEMGGYRLGDNLIITYETSLTPLDTRLVKKKIDEIILK